jgi:hypothetical protein
VRGLEGFLSELREDLKARSFRPLPARRRAIPKAGGKVRYLGIATIRDRVAQASLKLVLEPISEADFLPCSYGFRPNRRARDAVAEVHHFASRSYEWIVEGDIKACFDEISHSALMDRVRERVGDKGVLDLVKAFLKAGILDEDGTLVDTNAGTPQGSILSSAQPDAAGLDRVLQVRMLERDFQLSAGLPLEGDHQMAGAQAQARALEGTAPTLRHLARRGRDGTVRSGKGERQVLLLPGNTHPDTMAEHGMK